MKYLCREALGVVAVSWFGGESLLLVSAQGTLNKIVACWLRAISFVGVMLFIDCKVFCCVEEFSMFCSC